MQHDKAREDGDFAPSAARAPLVGNHPASPVEAEQLNIASAPKRKRTTGETIFDLTAYGGVATIGNELASVAIVHQKGKNNFIGRAFEKMETGLQKVGKPGGYVHDRMTFLTFAIFGGMLMVPIIKMLEDNKGKLVRFADRTIHGKQAESDPNMVRAHEEMDNAPHQTWGSLWKGRALTVTAAYVVDATVNWKHGLSARLLKNTPLKDFGSLEHISHQVADATTRGLTQWFKLSPERAKAMHEPVNTGFGLLTLSTALTVLFYASSKLFASRSEQQRELRDEVHGRTSDNAGQADKKPRVAHLDQLERSDAPTTSVSAIEAQARLATPEHAVGA